MLGGPGEKATRGQAYSWGAGRGLETPCHRLPKNSIQEQFVGGGDGGTGGIMEIHAFGAGDQVSLMFHLSMT